MTRPIYIDTDTASDDAVALMMAFQNQESFIITGIGVVAGNVPLSQAVQNALFVRELCGASVSVYAGAHRPLVRPLKTAQHIHGNDGMGNIGLALSGRTPDDGHAVQALINAANIYEGELELVTLGPLTNIALALSLAPEIANKIKHCTIMGGTSDYYGNLTAVSEYNIWADPEAAEIVFASDMSKIMVGWDISRKYASFTALEAEELRCIGTEKAKVAIDSQITLHQWCSEVSKVNGFDFPDPVAMAIALAPQAITRSKMAAVSVVMNDGPTCGMTIIGDRNYSEHKKNTEVILEADRNYFIKLLRDALK
ncbi:nucleoside hydrolase [Paremcibacter congregatus]|uniref:Nucleoside hydrolase n=1 Tax=Paremcibacter congregatus TaxID=2043170 RepID=A0A2G4YNM3_9PROT|nr:nucleoside hydrolase [Paremcibacter congregatus]PHZ83893.1 nucleoside hydrolase [Paremcibacter congregatus]QDE27597.1 nucleoside hydrolase [Paremcibacter congregatus]